jgi:hypothetical protein
MHTRRLSAAAACVLLAGLAGTGAGEQSPPASPAADNKAGKLPETPSQLFAAVAKDARPQWRPYFRETVPHAATDRYKAALALGAVAADCFLAAEVRDVQQVRNLLTDMAPLEMMLSINRQMGPLRQKVTDLAADGDWQAVRAEIASLMAHHAKFFGEQKDGHLAELERIGCWLRAFHVSARFSSKLPAPPAQPCIWSPALLTDLLSRASKLNAATDSKTLQSLTDGLNTLTKTWSGETTKVNAAARLATSLPLLEAMEAELINDESRSEPPKPDKPPLPGPANPG